MAPQTNAPVPIPNIVKILPTTMSGVNLVFALLTIIIFGIIGWPFILMFLVSIVVFTLAMIPVCSPGMSVAVPYVGAGMAFLNGILGISVAFLIGMNYYGVGLILFFVSVVVILSFGSGGSLIYAAILIKQKRKQAEPTKSALQPTPDGYPPQPVVGPISVVSGDDSGSRSSGVVREEKSTTRNPDGTVKTITTKTHADGSISKTTTETKENPDGSITETEHKEHDTLDA